MEKYIEKFIEYLTFEKKYSELTVSSYEKDLNDYMKYLNVNKLKYNNLEYKDVVNYMIYLKGLKLKPTSVNRHLSSIRSFYKYLIDNKITNSNPFKLVKGPKKEKKLPNYLKYDEFLDLLNSLEETPLGIRNRMILELLFATGIRVSELVNIKIKDIEFKDRSIKITGKGKKDRIVYFNKVCQEVMSNYVINARQELLKGKKNDYLIINHLGNKITSRGVQDIIEKILLKSSIKHKISPHTLRHTFATLLLKEGMDIREVQELLGHERLETTSIYTHVTNEELRKAYLNALPRE